MSRFVSRPVVLLPLGVALVLAGLLTGLNSIGAWRWGSALDDNQTCGSGQQGMCLVREDVAIDGPDYTWRNAGDDWDLRPATGRAHEVSLPGGDSDDLEDAQVRQGVMLSQPDGDVVGVEVDGRTIGTTWFGAYGTLQLLGLGLLVTSLGAGLIPGPVGCAAPRGHGSSTSRCRGTVRPRWPCRSSWASCCGCCRASSGESRTAPTHLRNLRVRRS